MVMEINTGKGMGVETLSDWKSAINHFFTVFKIMKIRNGLDKVYRNMEFGWEKYNEGFFMFTLCNNPILPLMAALKHT